jgi:uncharacterized protein (TIRG00374 family)
MDFRKFIDRRHIIYLVVLALGLYLLVPHVLGLEKILARMGAVRFLPLALALVAETMRFLFSASSTIVLARLFERKVSFAPMVESFFAGGALNRTFSAGGVPGIILRIVFLTRQGVAVGAIGVIFLIEDIAGVVVGGCIFLVGLIALGNNQPSVLVNRVAIALIVGAALLAPFCLYLIRDRAGVERISHALARRVDALIHRVLHRTFYTPERLQRVLDDFYAGLSAARRAPALVAAAFVFNIARHSAGIATLYFSFAAFDHLLDPGILLLLYTSINVLASTNAAPAEVFIMGGSFAVLSLLLGFGREVSFLALVLSRTISFWLPILIGYFALWDLRRRAYV